MPLNRQSAQPPHSHPELVDRLAQELRDPQPSGGAGIPDITEEMQTYGDRIHVRVIWDRWADVPHDERGPIILDAYGQVRGEAEMLRVTLASGFTIEEYRRYAATPRDSGASN